MPNIHYDDVLKLLRAIDLRDPFGPRDYCVLVLAAHTGLRISELVGLTVHMVFHQGAPRQVLDLPAQLCKNHHGREIPLSPTARKAIGKIVRFNVARGFSIAPHAPLLVSRRHNQLPVCYLQRLVAQLRKQVGLDVKASPTPFDISLPQG